MGGLPGRVDIWVGPGSMYTISLERAIKGIWSWGRDIITAEGSWEHMPYVILERGRHWRDWWALCWITEASVEQVNLDQDDRLICVWLWAKPLQFSVLAHSVHSEVLWATLMATHRQNHKLRNPEGVPPNHKACKRQNQTQRAWSPWVLFCFPATPGWDRIVESLETYVKVFGLFCMCCRFLFVCLMSDVIMKRHLVVE